jgi:ABC-2 type transport system ATP-binding protein
MSAIEVSNLCKSFNIYKKQPGILGSIKSLFRREYLEKKAVNNISFEIEEGELVGFIGPNGAGKTTTLKCLSGLIFPTSGNISVLGYRPFDRKKEFLKKISLTMGQKNQLWWDLPPMETFLLNKDIYGVDDSTFKKTLGDLVELLDIEDVLNVQVRKLSLGQRMKCELACQLIHSPKVLFLDEPTIGLDILMQQRLRQFIRSYNKHYKATVILTSHYMEDVKELCKRVIIIDHGEKLYDGDLDKVSKKFSQHKTITVFFNKAVDRKKLIPMGQIEFFEPNKVILSVARDNSNLVAAKLLEDFPVADINIEEPDIQDIIRKVFTSIRKKK